MFTNLSQGPSSKAARGMTLIEVIVALPIVLVALGMFLQMLTAGIGVRATSGETWAVSCAAQDVLERMRNTPFRELFRQYNADPMDDVGGAATGPGNVFAVGNMEPIDSDDDGFVGEVILPFANVGTQLAPIWHVREDHANEELGTPRDLNADSLVDAFDHSNNYSILPVLVRVRWQGRWGPRTFTLSTVLSEER
ncbi:MAG: prepilin-type N-terminal cleavage/methylation domain-containing protein [bacterium]|nr:prepilin-type N-terminal cleavage/methylation domain-containing protein [bacterium]